jgi:hypothetical protein
MQPGIGNIFWKKKTDTKKGSSRNPPLFKQDMKFHYRDRKPRHWFLPYSIKTKVNFTRTGHEAPEEEYRYSPTTSLTSELDRVEFSTPLLGRLTPRKDPVPIVSKAVWVPGPFWTCTKNIAPTVIRSPDRPGRRKSLYRLRYPGPLLSYSIPMNLFL